MSMATPQVMEPSENPVFTRPPISELGIGVFFRNPSFLTTAHLGRFWASISKEFPLAEDHSPIGQPSDWISSKEGLPLPRIWLIERDETSLIQLQLNRFHLNWRRRKDSDAYPGFAEHQNRLLKYWQTFCDFLNQETKEPIAVTGAELLKVSHLYEGKDWTGSAAVPTLFPILNLNAVPGDWGMDSFTAGFALTRDEIPIQVNIKTAHTVTDRKRILQLEIHIPITGIEATSKNPGNLAERLKRANQLANLVFTSITSQEAQRNVWQRTS